ncbi:MAG TPA: metallophosphoesterase family protein [Polyangiaceae bacterium]|nr:metallophosphoesterase family protein [Polyangiaceae bacterium]
MTVKLSRRAAAPSSQRGKHERRTLALREETLRLAVVADTHSRAHERSCELIAAERPDYILHAGDIGSLDVLDELGKLAPVLAIRGNIDTQAAGLADFMTISITKAEQTLVTLLLLHIGVYGAKLRADAARLARQQGAALVICGHSHIPFIGRDAGIAIFNPGSMGPRRFQLPIVFGVMELEGGRIRMHHVDCETGRVWRPPGA